MILFRTPGAAAVLSPTATYGRHRCPFFCARRFDDLSLSLLHSHIFYPIFSLENLLFSLAINGTVFVEGIVGNARGLAIVITIKNAICDFLASSKRGHVVWTRFLLNARADAYQCSTSVNKEDLSFIGSMKKKIAITIEP